MKLLILTCSTGGGHNSAAKAVAQAARDMGAECTVVDALRFLPLFDGKVISRGHTFVYRHLPRLFGAGYKYEERGGARAFRIECSRGARSLHRFIAAGGFDAVITVHVFAGFMLASLRAKNQLNIPAALVATDYTCSPGVADCDLDLTFVPYGLTDEFVSCGLPAERVVETGIPVSKEYSTKIARPIARNELGLDKDGKLILLMCGSMGCGPMEELALELCETLGGRGTVAALCGTNERLRDQLSREAPENLRAVGFTKDVPLWMDAADMIISKPGGLTSSEAMAKRLPMIVIDAVPGCETKNREYLTASGCALTSATERIPYLANELLTDEALAARLVRNMEQNFPHGAAKRICERVMSLVNAGELSG